MRNDYGEKLDLNGYAPSIIDTDGNHCFWCKRNKGKGFARHEVFHGAFRQKSKALGTWVLLCSDCHMRLHEQDAQIDKSLKVIGQKRAMEHYGWNETEFRKQFGKNYI